MNRNQFEQRHQLLNLHREELDRKWQLYLREQEERELMESFVISQKTQSSTMGGGSGGGVLGEEYTLTLVFDDISNADMLVGDSTDVYDWNRFFVLPAYGTPFSSVTVDGNTVILTNSGQIEVKGGLMYDYNYNTFLLEIIDTGCISIVGGDAFSYCEGLTSITLLKCTKVNGGEDSDSWDYGGFGYCINLESINMPMLQEARQSAFESANITELNLPSLISAGNYCFNTCTALTTVSLSALTTAGNACFQGCSALTSISLPALTSAGNSCFNTCTALTTVSFSNCAQLGSTKGFNGVFVGCNSLESVSVHPSALSNHDILALYSQNSAILFNGSVLTNPFSGYTGDLTLEWDDILNVPVGNPASVSDWNTFFSASTLFTDFSTPFTGVTVVGNEVTLSGGENIILDDNHFNINANLISVTDTGCVATLYADTPAGCFTACTALVSISFTDLTTAGNYCFSSCSALTSISLPALTSAGNFCFTDCTALTSISLPVLTSANDGCFWNCTALTSVSLPLLTDTSTNCFFNCNALTSVSLPALTTAGNACFLGCSALTSISLPSLVIAKSNCFLNCASLTSVSLPALTYMGLYCFQNCTDLTTITAPLVTHLGFGSFAGCTSLIAANFSLVKYLEFYSFFNCTSLTSINLPALKYAGNNCFESCTSLTSISLPALAAAGSSCFNNCTDLTNIGLSSCIYLGSTVGDNSIFNGITGNTITLTVPELLMTIDGGSPDGDIAYLQANNTVTVITT